MSKVIEHIKNYIKQNPELFRRSVESDLRHGNEIGAQLMLSLDFDNELTKPIINGYVVYTYDNLLPKNEVVGKGKLRSLLPTALKRVYDEGGI